MIWILLAGVGAILFYYVFVKPHRYWKYRGVKQTKPYVFLGDNVGVLFRRQSLYEAVLSVYNMYPGSRYFGMYQFYAPTLVIRDIELIKEVFVKDFDHFTDHMTFIDPEVDPIVGNNLFLLKGERWREMRATLSGSFTSSKMKHMFGLMKDVSENFIQYLLKKDKEMVEIEMKDIFTRFTNDIIATTAFGIKVDSFENQYNEFYRMGKEAIDFGNFWIFLKFLGYMAFPKIFKFFNITLFTKDVDDFFRNLIKDTIKTREKKGIVRPDMINLLMDARKGNTKHDEIGIIDSGFAVVRESATKNESMTKLPKHITDDDITSQALLFFFAGFETVSTLISFLTYELGINQDIQKKLREEVKKTSTECNGNITYEALLKMKYMDMVVSETLRKWPPAVATDRVCTTPYTINAVKPDEKQLHLNKGQIISLPIFGIHRDPEYYPEPGKFDPDRFFDENKDDIKPYTYLPFGCGPRHCIGSRFALLETKTICFYLLSKFEILPTAKTEIPVSISRKSFNLMAENGFWFGLKRISP